MVVGYIVPYLLGFVPHPQPTPQLTALGLLPIMMSSGTGAHVTQRIAAPVLGGMLSVLLL